MESKMMIITLAAVFMFAVCISTCHAQADYTNNNYLDIETPSFFNFNSPLKSQPDSLKKRPYFDFLSTLYRKDDSKANLFTNPPSLQFLTKRAVITEAPQQQQYHRLSKRAIVFRPLFVYRQQQIKKQQYQERKRRY
ncbi:hypothetical protein ACFFRR_008453 [Megaselia abdita]